MGVGKGPELLLDGFAVSAAEVVYGPAEEAGEGRGGELVVLRLKSGQYGAAPVAGGDEAGEVVLLEVHQGGEAGGAVLYLRPMGEQPVCCGLRQDEAAVAPAVGVGEDVEGGGVCRCRHADRHGDFRGIHAYLYLCGLCAVTYGHSEALGPDDAAAEGIGLGDGQAVFPASGDAERDVRHAFLVDPGPAEPAQIGGGEAVEDAHEVVPGGVAVGISFQVRLYAFPEYVAAHDLNEFFHHHRGFVVDDLAVDQAGVAQVGQLLGDGDGALGAVLAEGGGVERAQAVQPVVDLRVEGLGYPCGEVVGEDLLGPHLVEPLHRHQVAEPHVGGLVGYEFRAGQLVAEGGIGPEEHPSVVVEGGSGMLHAAVLESGQDDEVVLGEGVGYSGVLFEPLEGRGHLGEDVVELGRLGRIGLAVVGAETVAAVIVVPLEELTGHE